MSKQFACTKCGSILEEKELITVTNPEWIMKPTDDECCPYCKDLAIEIEGESND